MRRSALLTLFFLLAPLIGASEAVEVTWFGPARYERSDEKPNRYVATFPGQPGKGTLLVKNGGSDGMHRMSSALILVNGEPILGPNDFKRQTREKGSSINLADQNSVMVEARGQPEGYLTIQVVQEIGWLPLHEGDPGIPGDGYFVEGDSDGDPRFDLAAPVSLGQFEDGFTATFFFQTDTPIEDLMFNPIVATIGYGPHDECWFGFGAGIPFTGVTSFNGVEGFFANVPDAFIQIWVDWSNQSKPGCNLTSDDLFLVGFAVRERDDPVLTLDAAVILQGEDALP